MTDRKKPGVAFWATVALIVVLVGYPLSFGPACWITSRYESIVPELYMPFGWLLLEGPNFIRCIIESYASVGMLPETLAYIPCDEVHLTYVNSRDIR